MPNWLEVALRTLFAVAVLFVLTRLLGKRQVSQLSVFEYITGITIGSLAAYVSLDLDAKWYLGLVSLTVWVGVSLGFEYLQLKSKRARDLIDGKATVLMNNGKVLEKNLAKERITLDELLEMLRKKNVFDASKVQFAILDTSGELNVLVKKEHLPVTPSDLKLSVQEEKPSMAVIMDGQVLEESLRKIGLNEAWLHDKLRKLNVKPEEVFLAEVDSNNRLFLDPYEDHIPIH